MTNKISLVLNLLCMIGFLFLLITEKISSFGIALGTTALAVLAISSYTHYKNIKKDSI